MNGKGRNKEDTKAKQYEPLEKSEPVPLPPPPKEKKQNHTHNTQFYHKKVKRMYLGAVFWILLDPGKSLWSYACALYIVLLDPGSPYGSGSLS